jgi:general secretion pathway protein F
MIFEYQALNKNGDSESNFIDAPSEQAARTKIKSQGLYVVTIRKHDISENSEKKNTTFLSKIYLDVTNYFSLKLSTREIGTFSRQLATLLKAGMPLLVSISDIIQQIENQTFKRIIIDVREKLEEGSSMSQALERHRNVFSDMYINMVRVGENLGSLDEVIGRLADLEEKKNVLRGKIQAALWYPGFMIFFAIGVIFFLMVNIIPSLSKMFTELGRELPLPTRIVMGISSFMSSFWYVFFIIIAVAVYYFIKYKQTPEGREKIDELKMKIPGFKSMYNKLIVLRFTQNLGILLNNRVDIIKSFEIVQKIIGNVIIEKKIGEASAKIREGSSVANALSRQSFLPQLVIGMISAGEASDNLDSMLINIGNVYETELDLTITSLTSLIEPIIIVFMGVVIGIIVISVLLPIFEMNLIVQ